MVKTTTIATFPPGYLLEQIATTKAGGAFVSCANRGELYYIHVESDHPTPTLVHKYDRHQWAMGIIEAPHDPNIFYLVSSDALGQGSKTSHLYILNMADPAAGCGPQSVFTFPPEAKGLNGMCALSENVLLVADSFASCIWRVDLDLAYSKPTARASVWLSDRTMAGELKLPDFQPGTNGLKYSQVTGHVYYTSTQQKLFCQVRVDEKTLEPGDEVEVVARGMQGDDLIVDDSEAEKPVAFVTTHRDNTVLSISLDSKDSGRTEDKMSVFLEGTESDEKMLGPTAGAWAHGQVGKCAYFTTDGGLKNIVGGFVKCAKVVRVEY